MTGVLASLRARQAEMVDLLAGMVAVESPTADVGAVEAAAGHIADLGEKLLGASPQWITTGERPNLRWQFGDETRVLILGHIDTVWPLGTLARWPFAVSDGRATGPGSFDMKAGIVQGFIALSTVTDLDGITILFNSDEETGSRSSRGLIEQAARPADAVLVLEPSVAGDLKTARKGVSLYEIDVHGRAAHAGLDPEKGVNAVVELARQIVAVGQVARPAEGTTVTPTVASAGTTMNTVPAFATVHLDVRVASAGEQRRVDDAVRALQPSHPDARIEVRGGPNRPPFPKSQSAALFALARDLATEIGIAPPGGRAVGGGSDGNFTAGLGVATLDGLGAVGDHAHAEGEYVETAAMPERAALLAALIERLLSQ